MRQRIYAFLFCIIGLVGTGHSQNDAEQFGFANYLMDKSLYEDASFVIKELLKQAANQRTIDSAHFLLGKIYFQQKSLEEAVIHYNQVSPQSLSAYNESVFFSALSSAHLKDYQAAKSRLSNTPTLAAPFYNLKLMELAAVSLLDRDMDQFDSLASRVRKDDQLLNPQLESLYFHKKKIQSVNRKSPFKAGLLSALIPGAGRIYTGQPGQGIYQFIIGTLMGLQAWEGYRKDGPSSARFIAYGALFTSFYIGNIWGSAVNVKIYKNEVNQTVDEAILVDMHIPLRSLFR